jgi:hypothetical protein
MTTRWLLIGAALLCGCAPQSPQPTAIATPVTVGQTGNAPACAITPRDVSLPAQIYAAPDLASSVIGVLPYGSWLMAAERAEQWYVIAVPGSEIDGGFVQPAYVTLTQPCDCHGLCGAYDALPDQRLDCRVTWQDGTTLYHQPRSTAALAMGGAPRGRGSVVAVVDGGWYGFDPAVAQADNQGMERFQWVQDQGNLMFEGAQCDQLPILIYTPLTP